MTKRSGIYSHSRKVDWARSGDLQYGQPSSRSVRKFTRDWRHPSVRHQVPLRGEIDTTSTFND